MKVPKLIVSDLDGTLAPEGVGTLPSRVVEAIDRLNRVGIPFAVSSGRQHASLRRVFAPLTQPPLIISLNGGCICRGDDCLYTDPMPRRAALEIARQASRFPGCDVVLETREQCWVYQGNNGVVEDQLVSRQYHYAVIQDLAELSGEVIKVACYVTRNMEDFLAAAQRDWSGQVTVARSGAFWVDFNVSDKGKGLEAVCRLLGVDPADTVAFGDNLNDASMLAAAGQGYGAAGGNPALLARFPVCLDPVSELEKISSMAEKKLAIRRGL